MQFVYTGPYRGKNKFTVPITATHLINKGPKLLGTAAQDMMCPKVLGTATQDMMCPKVWTAATQDMMCRRSSEISVLQDPEIEILHSHRHGKFQILHTPRDFTRCGWAAFLSG
jgi:hypothetical protein